MAAKIAIATGPGVTIGSTVLLGAFTGSGRRRAAMEACELHAGHGLLWRSRFCGWEALTGPAGTGYTVRALDADVAYTGEPPAPHPVPLELARD